GADEFSPLPRKLGDRLAQVAVVVDHLVDAEASFEQLGSVAGRGLVHVLRQLGGRRSKRAWRAGLNPLGAQRVDELAEEERDAMFHLRRGGVRRVPERDLFAAAGDELGAVTFEEVMQHGESGWDR